MNRRTFVRSRPSALVPMAGWDSGFSIVAGLRRGLKEFARAVGPHRATRNAEPRVRSPQSSLPLSYPAFSLPPLPGSHAAGLVPPAGRTLYSPRLTIGGIATAACSEW
jgi:hypothetical protein